MRRIGKLLVLTILAACGTPRGALPLASDAGCTADSECSLPRCPTQCNGGQSPCGYPRAYGKAEALAACPCLDPQPGLDCKEPSLNECGPIPACAPLEHQTHAECRSNRCATVFEDGGLATF